MTWSVGGVAPVAPIRRRDAVLVHRAGGVVDRERAERPGLRLGVLEDRPAAGLDQQQLARTEATAPDRLGSAERHGAGLGRDRHEPVASSPRRPPAAARSDRPAPRPAGRPRRRSRRAHPTARGSRPCGGAAWRRAGAGRDGARAPRGSPSAGRGSGPSRSRSGARAPRRARANRSRRRTGAGRRRGARRAISEVAASPVRPRTCSRLPRTVLISPLWAIERNGCASRQTGCVFVA